jgi:hypothetical protein
LLVLGMLAGVGVFLGARYVLDQAMKLSDPAPLPLPKVETSAALAASLQERVKTFATALQSGGTPEPMVLTEQELNVLIASVPELAGLKDRVYISLGGDQIKGQVSLPLDGLPLARFRGRYLNGAATFKTSLENGVLIVTLDSLQVKGQQLPKSALSQFQQDNLAKDLYRDPRTAQTMRRLEKIEVKDGRITVKAKPPN